MFHYKSWAKRVVVGAAVLSAAALVLTGCSAPGSTASSEDTGPVTLKFWGWATGLEDAVKAWNSANPDIQIDFYRMTGDDGDKIPTAIDSGTAPDIFQLDSHAVPGYVINNRLADITSSASSLQQDFTEASWSSVTVNSAVYGVPQDSGPSALMYRSDIFKKYDIAVPTTWDEYLDAARKLHAANPKVYIAQFSANEPGFWQEQVMQNEGSWFGTSGDSWTVNVADQASQDVAQVWQTLVDEKLVKVVDMWTPEYWSDINDGTIASVNYAAWFPALLKSNAEKTSGKWSVASSPTFGSLDTAGQAGGSVDVLPANAKYVTQSLKFLTWLNDGDGLTYLIQNNIFPASLTGLASSDLLQADDFFGGQKINEIFVDAAKKVPGTWVDGPTFELTQQAIEDQFAKVATGDQTFAQALDNVKQKTISDIKSMGLNVAS